MYTKTLQEEHNRTLTALREEKPNEDALTKLKTSRMHEDLSKQESELSKKRLPISSSKKENKEDAEYRKSFDEYLRKGTMNQTLSGCSDSTGYAIPQVIQDIINGRLIINSPVRSFASVINVSYDNVDIPAFNQETIFAWGDETTVAPVSDIFQKKTLKMSNITAQPKATQKMLDDISIDIESWIGEILSDTFAEAENNAFINGDGLNKPTGILSYPATGANAIHRVINSTSTKLSLESILNLQASLNSRYEKSNENVFLTSKDALASIRTMQDAAGRYIWDGIFEDSQTTLLGVPLLIVNHMQNLTSGSDVMIYGNLRKGYQIADRANISIMRDPFSCKPYVVFYTVKRLSGDVKDAQALKILRMA